MHIHDLDGCSPTPLAHYLKALGVLRLVAEQCDPAARGWWAGERFRLATSLERADLESFFLKTYRPTPFVAPWNKGSGFYQTDDAGVAPLERSTAGRLAPFREGIAATRRFLAELAAADAIVRKLKDDVKDKSLSRAQRDALRQGESYRRALAEAERRFKSLKAELIPRVSAQWRGPHRDWIDAALVLDEERIARFPALLGTGGNDGRLDFTNNFMQRLGDVFELASPEATPSAAAPDWLRGALWREPVPLCLDDRAVGQFLPGNAGGANSANAPDATSLLNPFDFILMMEGSCLFTASAVKRLNVRGPSRAAAPFVVGAQAAGYASADTSDESARGEQWMPLWRQPMTVSECRYLLAEGRAQIGRDAASQPVDIARAAAGLGVARGIEAFQRFGYIERNGQSNLAVPLGRFLVRDDASPHLACLDDLAVWLQASRREAADPTGTARLEAGVRMVGEAIFDVVQRPHEPARWQALLRAMSDVEAVMRTGSGFKAQPIPPLRAGWIDAADDGSAEYRLALAVALQTRPFEEGKRRVGVRGHWLPIDDLAARRARFAMSGDATRPRLASNAGVVMHGRSGVDDAIALVERSLVVAAQRGQRQFPLRPSFGFAARLDDVAAWLDGQVDPERTFALARALMALRLEDGGREQPVHSARSVFERPARSSAWPDDAWLCLRLAYTPWPRRDDRPVPADPALLRRLASGDAGAAVELAVRRLGALGLRTGVRAASVPLSTARLWAAALAFPLSSDDVNPITQRLHSSPRQETAA